MFICHKGLFRFPVVLFGLVNAPATFSRLMRRFLRNTPKYGQLFGRRPGPYTRLDTTLSCTPPFFECIRKANLTLRPSKCEIGETTVSFLGHTLTEGEIDKKPSKRF